MFNKFMNRLELVLGPIALKMSNNSYIKSIMYGTMGTLAVSLIASVAVLIAKPPIPLENGVPVVFASWYAWGAQQTWLIQLNLILTGVIGICFLVGMTTTMCAEFKLNVSSTLALALGSFFICVANPTKVMINEKASMMVDFNRFGANSIFAAMILSILTVYTVKFFKEKNIGVPFPETVPVFVKSAFDALIPGFFVIIFSVLINTACHQFFDVALPDLLMTIFSPMIKSFDNVIVAALAMGLINLFWYMGIHGASIVLTIIGPILSINTMENLTNYAQGLPVEHFFTNGLRMSLVLMGGAGVFALTILQATSKSKTMRDLAKIGFIPSIFNVSEPTIFGTPIMYNVYLFIPFIGVPILNTILAWLSIDIFHLFTGTFVNLPSQMPVVMNAMLAHGSVVAGIVCVLILLIDLLFYFPFFKAYEKTLLEKEAKLKEEEIETLRKESIS